MNTNTDETRTRSEAITEKLEPIARIGDPSVEESESNELFGGGARVDRVPQFHVDGVVS